MYINNLRGYLFMFHTLKQDFLQTLSQQTQWCFSSSPVDRFVLKLRAPIYITVICLVEKSSRTPACTQGHDHTPTDTHTNTLRMIAGIVSESLRMTHSMLQFHVPVLIGT